MSNNNNPLLLNQCLKCGMRYDSVEQLATHQKKFCIGGDPDELNQLERKLHDNAKTSQNLFGSDKVPLSNITDQNVGKKNDFEKLYTKAVQDREMQMQLEIDKLKLEKADMRARKQQEEDALLDLIRESEQKKERDIRARIERDQIRNEIASLEKTKLTNLEQEKKTQLEKLAADREALRQKEEQLIKEVESLEQESKTMARIREEDLKKQDDALDKISKRGGENNKVNTVLLQEKSDRVAQLKAKREMLEFERQKIMGNLEKVKSGDVSNFRKSNYGLFAANQMLGDVKSMQNYGPPDIIERIKHDEQKLQQLKSEHRDAINREHIPPNYAYGSPPTNPNPVLQRNSSFVNQYEKYPNRPSSQYNRSIEQSTMLNSPLDYNNSLPPEFQKLLYDKDLEKERLKHELEVMKLQSAKSESALTLKDMQLRINGVGSGAPNNTFNMYGKAKEFFIQNESRSVDLSEDERYVLNLQAQEVDALRLLSQLPVGTDLYRFKMEQYKELSTARAEAEKIVQEHRLLKIRREFEKQRREDDRRFENEKWIDEQRKNVIANQIRGENQSATADKRYDPLEGFVIHWDYSLGIPKRNDSCQIVFGIYINGDEVCPAKLIGPYPCEVDSAITNRCIFGNSFPINDVPANANALIIFELQIFPSKDSTNPRLMSYGWSQLDLFDSRRELKRGKFKVPVYQCPTNTNQDIDGIKNLIPVQDGVSWVHLRISYPDDNEFGKAQTLYPESTHMDYVIPQIHIKNYRSPMEAQFTQDPLPNYQDMNRSARSITPAAPYQNPYPQAQRQMPTDNDSYIQPAKPRAKMPPPYPASGQDLDSKTNPNQSVKLPDFSLINQSNISQPKKALHIVIHGLKNHVARNHLRISCALLEDAKMVLDEAGQNCVFNTQVHNPFEKAKNASIASLNNKAHGNNIIFNQSHKFLKDVGKLAEWNKGQKDYFLMFQVLEKPEPLKLYGASQTMSYKMSELSSYGKLEYDLFGWFLFKINKSDGKISTGKFVRNLFNSPLRKPPFDLTNEKKGDSELEFSINEVEWDSNPDDGSDDEGGDDSGTGSDDEIIPPQRQNQPQKQTKQPTKPIQQNPPKENFHRNSPDENLKSVGYIPNAKPQFEDRPFEKGMGIDLYFDGCKLLPDNVSVVKAIIEIIDFDLSTVTAESDVAELDSSCHNPTFDWKMEIRPTTMVPTALALITLMTIDAFSGQACVVGYSAINLFINRSTRKPPAANSETNVALFSGNYQLPIYCQEPSRTRPFTLDKILGLERIPAASALVRINQAPFADNKVLNMSDFPKKDWLAKGIKLPRPVYEKGTYSTYLFHLQDFEQGIVELRQNAANTLIREAAQRNLKANNLNKTKDVDIMTWIDEKIQEGPSVRLLDLTYFSRYYPELGFKFALDGLHNAPTAQPYVGIYVPNPPGAPFTGNPDVSKTQLNTVLDWEGPLLSPRFMSGFSTWTSIPFNKNAHIIVDIRTINFSKKPHQITGVGWTIVPLFTPYGQLISGLYQVPLIAGDVNKSILDGLMQAQEDPWSYILQQINQKKPVIKWLPNTSAMVRLVDCQREGHFNVPWDFTRVDTKYLPQASIQKYLYNAGADSKAKQGKQLKTIAPRKEEVQAFQQKISEAFAQQLGFE